MMRGNHTITHVKPCVLQYSVGGLSYCIPCGSMYEAWLRGLYMNKVIQLINFMNLSIVRKEEFFVNFYYPLTKKMHKTLKIAHSN